jgi:hypothetical protein
MAQNTTGVVVFWAIPSVPGNHCGYDPFMARLVRFLVLASLLAGGLAALRQRKMAENARRYGADK